jgi:hypothetical protein
MERCHACGRKLLIFFVNDEIGVRAWARWNIHPSFWIYGEEFAALFVCDSVHLAARERMGEKSEGKVQARAFRFGG